MHDDLIARFREELGFIQDVGKDFAKDHPGIAGGLDFESRDPHIQRLIQAFALLTARTRCKLDDEFPEITSSLLSILYPHYERPIPSTAIAEFAFKQSQGIPVNGYRIERGNQLETGRIDGYPIRYRTCAEVVLWPIEVSNCQFLGGQSLQAPSRLVPRANGLIQINLKTLNSAVRFRDLDLTKVVDEPNEEAPAGNKPRGLRFYIDAALDDACKIYEILFNQIVGCVIAKPGAEPSEAHIIDRSRILPVGFDEDEAIFDLTAQSFPGYRLVSEYFACPQKFLFFELQGIDKQVLATMDNEAVIYILLEEDNERLRYQVKESTFRLGCTPIVNLYKHSTEPIRLKHRRYEYPIIPDVRSKIPAHEIYSVDSVKATKANSPEIAYRPFFSIEHGENAGGSNYWHATRKPSRYSSPSSGTDVFLSLVNGDFTSAVPTGYTVDVETTCCSRELPSRLGSRDPRPRLKWTDGAPFVSTSCISPITNTVRPPLMRGTIWRLVSHLSLNHLSLVDAGATALKEMLSLYNFSSDREAASRIEAITDVSRRRVLGQLLEDEFSTEIGLCRGVEITMSVDGEAFLGTGLYLFGTVLDRFFSLYTSINSFTRLVVTSKNVSFRNWPPSKGQRVHV